jgi:acyl carrier protein
MDALDFDDLVAHLARELHLALPDPVLPSTGLFDDLELDSLGAFELLVAIEDVAGCDAPPLELPRMFTLGDVHDYYVRLRTGRPR